MNISLKLLKEMKTCKEGINWYKQVGKPKTLDQCLPLVISHDGFKYANWFLTQKFTKEQNQRYALFCAELVLPVFESKYPDDKRPRECVQAIKAYMENPSKENKDKLNTYAAAAAIAVDAARAAYCAAAIYAGNSIEIKTKILEYGLKLLKGNE